MFSFHKPKIYRSLQGCCICRAKSSSSRFTDSKRYESDFDKCFMIDEVRQGEICNACVLLVKRWKKLPSGSTRNWHHVVDARAGPGTKSITKIKNRVKEQQKEDRKLKKHKHRYQRKPLLKPSSLATAASTPTPSSGASSPASHHHPNSPGALSDDIQMGDECLSDHSLSPDNSDTSDMEEEPAAPSMDLASHRSLRSPLEPLTSGSSGLRRRRKPPSPCRGFSSFLDLDYWKRTEICCGTIFKGANGELLLDASLWRPCGTCKTPRPSPRASPSRRQDSECSIESGVESAAASDDSGLGLVSSQDVTGPQGVSNHSSSSIGEGFKFPTPPDTQPSTPTAVTAPAASVVSSTALPPEGASMSTMSAAAASSHYSDLVLDLSLPAQPPSLDSKPPSLSAAASTSAASSSGHSAVVSSVEHHPLHADMPPPVLDPQLHCIQLQV